MPALLLVRPERGAGPEAVDRVRHVLTLVAIGAGAWLFARAALTPLLTQGRMADNAFTLCADGDGNPYVSLSDFTNTYIRKYSPDGDSLMQIVNEQVRVISALVVTSAGAIVVTGSCVGASAKLAGIRIADSIFDYTTFIAGYDSRGAAFGPIPCITLHAR